MTSPMGSRIDTGPPAAEGRFPVRADTDGDFDLADLTAAPAPHIDFASSGDETGGARPGVAEAAESARLWDLSESAAAARSAEGLAADPVNFNAIGSQHVTATRSPGENGQRPRPATLTDLKVLHCFETTSVLRPPVAANTAALTPAIASAWLTLAIHWIGVAAESADLRFLNGACKLLGAVAIHPVTGPELRHQITTTAHLLKTATASLQIDLANRLAATTQRATQPGTPRQHASTTPHPKPFIADGISGREHDQARSQPRIMVLARAGSGSPARLAEMTAEAGVRLTAVCWYGPPSDGRAAPPASGYDQAWYPPDQPANDQHASIPQPDVLDHAGSNIPQIHARDWAQVAEALHRYATDVVILAAMPIVPATVLSLARLGVINAHNGALPTYRGMDAVAWALLNNEPIVCTLHRADPGVDTGDVYASAAVPFAPAGTLRARVKHTQLQMLTAAAVHVATTGSLPAAKAQAPELGRQFYRLHSHLKRVLDASPFARPAFPAPNSPPVSGHRPGGGLP